MTNLTINRVNYRLSEDRPELYVSKKENLLFRMQVKQFKQRLSGAFRNDGFIDWIKDINNDDYIYYSFSKPVSDDPILDDFFTVSTDGYPFNYFKAKFVREQLIKYFHDQRFLVEPYPKGIDFSIYERMNSFNQEWSVYKRYDFLVRPHRNEIAFNIGSENTLISNNEHNFNHTDKIRVIDTKDGFIKSLAGKETLIHCRIIANKQKRKELLINNEAPKKLSYEGLYRQLANFYTNQLLLIDNDYLKIEAGGLKNVDAQDLFRVNMNENQMLFGKGQTDINAVTGMRDYGIYKSAPNAMDTKFIFIYENRDDANKFYLYLKNGLKHFPGLWSYVGIPPTLADEKLQYNGVSELKDKFDAFIEKDFSNDNYENYFAIIIEPFSSQEKQEVDEEQPELYYYIKQKFLSKGIPSQFIHYKSIRSGSFHYFLPNISIGILAKLGGIPWRLKSKKYEELVIGFNQKIVGDDRYIGSAVFFTNEGELGGTFGFPETDSENTLIRQLRTSIEKFIAEKETVPERLVIHYYKPQSSKEQKSIENLIQNELRLNIPFAIVEINDSKSQVDICFDNDSAMGMPESGTYVKIGKTEYLLFNNTRYQKNQSRSILEELPIKITIHFADTGGFSHKDLISQVYEFSRLYWKGLKQRSQPATTIYSKLIADFASHFNGNLPNNKTVQSTPWFL